MPDRKVDKPKFMTYDDFQKNAEDSTLFAEVIADLREERRVEVIDNDQAQANRTWSKLAHQVVGQEQF